MRGDLGPGDRLRLLTFNMRVQRLVDFTQPGTNLDDAVASLRGGGSSAVFDGLAVALTSADPPGRRRLVVLFSDGQDSSSISDADTLLDVARRSTPTVAIVLGSTSSERPASLLRSTSALSSATVGALTERIASETGGFVHHRQAAARRCPRSSAGRCRTSARATSSTSRRAESSAAARTRSTCG